MVDVRHPVGIVADGLRLWLASGAAQAPSGAFYAWRDNDGRPSFEYPEITGYALTHFAGLTGPTEREVTSGHRAARWLLDRLDSGDFSARGGWDGQATYTFDLAMIATGLMAFGSCHSSEEMVASGMRLARAIQAEIDETGTLRCVPAGSRRESSRSAWSTEGLAHLVKAVQCLLWADDLGADGSADAAAVLVRDSLSVQRASGRFVTHASDEETMLHPHLYAVEGLWMFGTATGDEDAIRRATRATEWVWSHQQATGAFPRWVAIPSGEEGPAQGDLTAQALRAALLLDVGSDCRDATAEWLSGVAVWNEGNTAAIPYQPDSGTVHQNTWSTLFAAQTLEAYVAGKGHVSWRSLV
jgi:hypothetical protein